MQKASEVFFVKVPWIEQVSKLLYKFEETGKPNCQNEKCSSLISQKSFGEVIFVGFKFPKFLDYMKSVSHHHKTSEFLVSNKHGSGNLGYFHGHIFKTLQEIL